MCSSIELCFNSAFIVAWLSYPFHCAFSLHIAWHVAPLNCASIPLHCELWLHIAWLTSPCSCSFHCAFSLHTQCMSPLSTSVLAFCVLQVHTYIQCLCKSRLLVVTIIAFCVVGIPIAAPDFMSDLCSSSHLCCLWLHIACLTSAVLAFCVAVPILHVWPAVLAFCVAVHIVAP